MTKKMQDWLLGAVLVIALVVAYLPVQNAGFIWDDDHFVTQNPGIVGPLGIKALWTTQAADDSPLTQCTFWVEHALWGFDPLMYHMVNVLLQAACALMLWAVLRRLRVPGAWLGAALWALHPVQAESIAWVTETKNTQSGFFFLLAIFFYAGMTMKERNGERASRDYSLTILFSALAMASKSSTVVLPAILILCALWVEETWEWGTVRRHAVRMIPVFLLTAISGAATMWATGIENSQAAQPVTDPMWVRTWPERLITAGRAVWFYLGKLVWPHPLLAIYPRWQIDTHNPLNYLPLVLLIAFVMLLWMKRDLWSRPYLFVMLWFLIALSPVLGLVDQSIMEFSFVFDHFQFLASIAPMALAGAGIAWLAARAKALPPSSRVWLQAVVGSLVLLVYGSLTSVHSESFASLDTLWTDTLAENPAAWVAHYDLGRNMLVRGQLVDAIGQFQAALELNPHDVLSHTNLGVALLQNGQADSAMRHFRQALAINPAYPEAHNNLGNVMMRTGDVDGALTEFQTAVRLDPGYQTAQQNLAKAQAAKDHRDGAALR